MKAAWVRLVLVSALFIGWLGYLGYLVAERPDGGTVVLSRPQFQVSDLDVVANVKKGSDVVTVTEVLYPHAEAARQLAAKEIKVTNLADCRPPGDRDKVNAGPRGGWRISPGPAGGGSGRHDLPGRRHTPFSRISVRNPPHLSRNEGGSGAVQGHPRNAGAVRKAHCRQSEYQRGCGKK